MISLVPVCLIFIFVVVRSHGERECQKALGMENGAIADGQITASSSWNNDHVAHAARLHLKPFLSTFRIGSWTAGRNHGDLNPWLQIDLGLQHNVTRVATQGRQDYPQWVTSYNVQKSNDGVTFHYYVDQQGQRKEFVGNSDQNTVVSHKLNPSILARYIRFLPLTFHGDMSLRVELYGETEEGEKSLGMENGSISDGQITASSYWGEHHEPYLARLHLQAAWSQVRSWAAGANNVNQWLQTDLSIQHNVTRVATQGRHDFPQWVKKYNLQYSDDGVTFHYYTDQHGVTKEFTGNTDMNSVVPHELNPPIKARFIRFRPLEWNGHISMRVELYGCTQECQQALGVANGAFTELQITASTEWNSDFSVHNGRLFYKYHSGAWEAQINDDNQWMQIDLGGRHIKITRVATQGRHNSEQRVTTYKLQYSDNAVSFYYYKEQGQTSDKVFSGNSDSETVVSHELIPPIRARYIRFRPVTWNAHISMRVELYGCALECQDALGMENGLISDVQLSASSQWDDNEGAYRGRLYLTEVWVDLHRKSGAWVSGTNDVNQWLQIDVLGLSRKYVRVTRVATQGRDSTAFGVQYVKTYKLQYSNDGINFQYYKESGQATAKEFQGNNDHYTAVHHDLEPAITARYVRFRPLTWNLHISMRVEIYGCTQDCIAPAIGIEAGNILDSQMTATTGNASLTRLNGRFAWCPLIDGYGEYIQIDLGGLYRLCAVATQGFPGGNKHYLKEYKLEWSNDQITWDKSAEVLKGNTNCFDVVKNSVPEIYARHVRLYPVTWYVRGCVRMELYGEPWPEVPTAFTLIAPGKALTGHVISSLNNTNTMECLKMCLVNTQCKSFNYGNRLKKCEVRGFATKEHELTDQEGFYYYFVNSNMHKIVEN